jgi:hypothetical protein
MMPKYIVGVREENRSKVVTVEGDDALIAALRAKHENPSAMITYVRKSNQRGDRRHPHQDLQRRGSK